MTDTRRNARRRWALYAVVAAVVLYGIVGFPTPDDLVTDPGAVLGFDIAPAAADTQRECITTFWGAKLPKPVCYNRPHTHAPPPTTTAKPPTTTARPPTTTARPPTTTAQ